MTWVKKENLFSWACKVQVQLNIVSNYVIRKWTPLFLYHRHSKRAFLTTWQTWPQTHTHCLSTPAEREHSLPQLFLSKSGLSVIVLEQVTCPSFEGMSVTLIGQPWSYANSWACRRNHSPMENWVVLPGRARVDAVQVKITDVHCFPSFYRSVNCHHPRKTIRKAFRWPASHPSRDLCLVSVVWFQWSRA